MQTIKAQGNVGRAHNNITVTAKPQGKQAHACGVPTNSAKSTRGSRLCACRLRDLEESTYAERACERVAIQVTAQCHCRLGSPAAGQRGRSLPLGKKSSPQTMQHWRRAARRSRCRGSAASREAVPSPAYSPELLTCDSRSHLFSSSSSPAPSAEPRRRSLRTPADNPAIIRRQAPPV